MRDNAGLDDIIGCAQGCMHGHGIRALLDARADISNMFALLKYAHLRACLCQRNSGCQPANACAAYQNAQLIVHLAQPFQFCAEPLSNYPIMQPAYGFARRHRRGRNGLGQRRADRRF